MAIQSKIVVTGGAGFVGSHLVRRLVADGKNVVVLVKTTTDRYRLADIPNLEYLAVDLLNLVELRSVFKSIKVEGVFHLAASNIQSGKTASDDEVVKTNILGIVNLLSALNAHEYSFFVSTGSFLEYGSSLEPVSETRRCEPTELYSITKLASTLYVSELGKRTGRPLVALRVFTPYGPFLQSGRLIHELISCALLGKSISLSRPDVSRDFIYVKDLVDLCIRAAERAIKFPGEIFNAGSGIATSLQSLAGIILSLTKSVSSIKWGNQPLLTYDSIFWQADMSKTFSCLDWKPQYNLIEGLLETIAHFK